MTAEDPNPARPKERRILPSVSEVMKELTARSSAPADLAFRAARQVCAEELKRVKEGKQTAPLEELVSRALKALEGSGSVIKGASVQPAPAAGDDPFLETTGALDLRWGREVPEPFTEQAPQGHHVSPAEPRASAPPPTEPPAPKEHPLLHPSGAAPKWELEAPQASPLAAPAAAEKKLSLPPIEPRPRISLAEGPGDETIDRLSREAAAISFGEVVPKPTHTPIPFARDGAPEGSDRPLADSGGPFAHEGSEPGTSSARPGDLIPWSTPDEGEEGASNPPPEEPPEPRSGSRLPLAIGAIGVVVLGGIGWLLYGLWSGKQTAPPLPPSPGHVALQPKTSVTATPAVSSSPIAIVPVGTSVPEKVVVVTPAARPTSTALPPPTPGKKGAPTQPPGPSPAAVATAAPVRVPTGPAPSPAPVHAVPSAARNLPPSRAQTVASKDWAGPDPIFSIHFGSFQDRARAEKEAARIGGAHGKPAFAAEIDLGPKGTWYRVMLGRFPTLEEAAAFRAELEAKGTPGMSFVYRIVPKS
jgi:hypothetical protein